MDQSFIVFLIGAISALAGAYVGNLIAQLRNKTQTGKLEERIEQLREQEEKLNDRIGLLDSEKNVLQKEKEQVNMQLSRQSAEYDALNSELEKEKERFKNFEKDFNDKFKNLANKILETKSEKFTKQNKDNLDILLKPLQEKIEKFEKKVEETNKEAIDRNAALREQIKGLTLLNEQMSKEATNLTKALKGDSKTQGNWGELVLERVLEKSGLEKDREYEVQQSFTNEEGKRVLPDVVIHLPDNKKMIIDSKVSLTAYERYINAEEALEKEQALKQHLLSLKKHVEQLSAKNYQDLYTIESPDFVLLFIPVEPAFAIALNEDTQLYNWAFEKNIVIVTPTTLLATLRTIDTMWNNEKQQQNALEIATQAGRLYDQFVNLTDDLIKVGNQLKTVQGTYDTSMKKLTGKGNLIKKVEAIKKLGIKQKKNLNEKLIKRAEEDEDE